MTEHLLFPSRKEFRNWLQDNCLSSGDISMRKPMQAERSVYRGLLSV